MPIGMFMLSLFSVIALADYGPPKDVESNVQLAKDAVAKYKALNDSILSYYADIKFTNQLCSNLNSSNANACSGSPICEEFNQKPIKDKASYCMNEFLKLRGKGDLLHLNNKDFLFGMNDSKYANFPVLGGSLIKDVSRLELLITNSQTYLKSAYQIFAQKYMDALNQEYQAISINAELQGKIRGNCIYLKQAIDDMETLFLINSENPDYGVWFQFATKINALKVIANELRPKCPKNFQPADYRDIATRVQSFLSKIDREKWVVNRCALLEQDRNYSDICTTKDSTNPYFINLLIGGTK